MALFSSKSVFVAKAFALTTVSLLLCANMAQAGTNQVALRVLVISTGTASEDLGLDLINDVLDNAGIPYDNLNARNTDLKPEQLENPDFGRYNGVILTNSELYYYDAATSQGGSAFTAAEWQTLRSYETRYAVRESVMSGWPAVNNALGLDYGLEYVGTVSSATPVSATWRSPAGGREYFEYVKTTNPLVVNDFSYLTKKALAPTATTPTVTPLLVANNDSNKILVAALKYPDGREVLYSTVAQAPYLVHSKILAYEFVNFATKGVFLGARQIHLTAHIDDLFLETDLWNGDLNTTPSETDPGFASHRMTDRDVANAVYAQSLLRYAHPLASGFTLDLAFNGTGARSGDPLTSAVVYSKNRFRFINHTWDHSDMNVATYDEASFQIKQNQVAWSQLGLPEFTQNKPVLVTGMHSGLHTSHQAFPAGANIDFFNAARDAGVRYLACDSSQTNENVEQYAPNSPILMLPRRPTAVFFNVTEPTALTDEYNFIFYERYFLPPYSLAPGTQPCSVYPAATCAPRTYNEIIAAEADTALRQLLEFRMWPYYMHQSNLRKYGSGSNTLAFDWLNAVISKYERNMKLPIKSLPYHQIGAYTQNQLEAKNANVTAVWNYSTNSVSVESDKPIKIWATGLGGGALYGGQVQRYLTLNPNTTTTFAVDRALAQ